MMKYLIHLTHVLTGHIGANASDDRKPEFAWCRDPLAHPAVNRMSERELADLPFERGSHHSPCKDG